MTWDFTPTQVMKGEIDYGFDDFRRDFFNQVKFNFGDRVSPEKLEGGFNLFWLVCHLSALMKSPDEIERQLSDFELPPPRELLEDIKNVYKDDIEMLIAIYQNLFLKYYGPALQDSWGDDKKAIDQALALVNLYIARHMDIPISSLVDGGTPHKRSLPI